MLYNKKYNKNILNRSHSIRVTMLNSIFNIYKKSLYFIVPFTTSVGFSSALVDVFGSEKDVFGQGKKAEPLHVFTTVIGYTAIGIATGITYPITFPGIVHTVLSTP